MTFIFLKNALNFRLLLFVMMMMLTISFFFLFCFPGDGMLSMRAKPPPEREFVDIFQKFKLSFNLLAKLKAHIHDPNAPELVHFLFTPLALIVDASHDSHYGPNLPSKVVAPLMTANAIDLLVNCLTSKESELWHSLGEPWYIPLEEWKDYVQPYRPVFMDGWSPSVSYPENGRKKQKLIMYISPGWKIQKMVKKSWLSVKKM